MKLKKMGNTGLFVSEFCLGTMTFGNNQWGLGGLTEKEASLLVDQAIDAGVNIFDTADIYSFGESEEILGKVLEGRRNKYIIATKVRGKMSDEPNDVGLSRQHILNSIDRSLKRLSTDYIDLYQVHSWDPFTPIEETLMVLDDLVRWGKVRYIGCSNFAAWQVIESLAVSEKAGLARFETMQVYYSLVGRDIENELVPLAEYKKLGILTWSPLAGGYLSGKYRKGAHGRRTASLIGNFPPVDMPYGDKILDVLEDIAKQKGSGEATIALSWLLSKPYVTGVIVGAKNPDQLSENLKAAELELTKDEIRRLDEVSARPLPYPQWMTAMQVQRRQD